MLPSLLVFVIATLGSALAQVPAPEQLAQRAHALAQQLAELSDVESPSDDALKLLAQRPERAKSESDEEREAQLYSQSGEAMEAFVKATDFSPAGPLRAALTKALDHHFLFAGPGAAKPADLASSPLIMTKLLGASNMPAEPIKDWGNHTLFVLSMRAAPSRKPSPVEQQLVDLLKKDRWPTADDVPARLLALRFNLGVPEAAGALTGLRAVEKLDAKIPSPPAKK